MCPQPPSAFSGASSVPVTTTLLLFHWRKTVSSSWMLPLPCAEPKRRSTRSVVRAQQLVSLLCDWIVPKRNVFKLKMQNSVDDNEIACGRRQSINRLVYGN